jgi:hypothetical protein
MLDSRRDCRYRRGAHRSIGIGLRKVSFHAMPGTPEEVPSFPLTLIHPSAWKVNSPKSISSALHSPGRVPPIGPADSLFTPPGSYYILWC